MPNETLKYQLAITLIPGIGDVIGKKLISYCGGVEAVFKETRQGLMKIPGIGQATVNSILGQKVFDRVEEEISFINKRKISPIFYTDSNYPSRLLNCEDSPMMIYYKGTADLNKKRIVAFVGTRRSTNAGKRNCEKLIEGLAKKNVLILSGLAYGIDTVAHRAALNNKMETIGVLGHGLDRVYPSQNKHLADSMIDNGGLLTEFMSNTKPDRENFPRRNRIVAGMCDAVVVVESASKGGALITAGLANSYNRDVFAVPGRLTDEYSQGCNRLIKTNQAVLVESAKDISYIMGWDDKKVVVKSQRDLFFNFDDDQKLVYEIIKNSGEIGIDKIVVESSLSASKVATALLTLEFEGLVQSLPGKIYCTY